MWIEIRTCNQTDASVMSYRASGMWIEIWYGRNSIISYPVIPRERYVDWNWFKHVEVITRQVIPRERCVDWNTQRSRVAINVTLVASLTRCVDWNPTASSEWQRQIVASLTRYVDWNVRTIWTRNRFNRHTARAVCGWNHYLLLYIYHIGMWIEIILGSLQLLHYEVIPREQYVDWNGNIILF